jgi:NitT/TauT family transport system substrate-binding protein
VVSALLKAAAVLLALAAGAAGCGGDDEPASGGDQGRQEVTTVKVTTIPTAAAAPLFVGIKQGFFKQERLRLETQFAEGGAAIIPSVQKGDTQFGFGNTISLFIARARGLQLPIVAAGQVSPEEESEDETAIMVPRDSPIRRIQDLEGKKIAVNTLQNIATLSIEASLDAAGVDPKSIEFLEVPFPESLPAIQSGKVDAAFFGEPFTTLADRAGARVIFRPFSAGVPRGQIGAYMTSESYAEENSDVVERFARAIERSNRYVIENPDAVRTAVVDFTEVPAEIANKMRLPVFVPSIEGPALQRLADVAERFGLLEERLDTSEMLRPGGS